MTFQTKDDFVGSTKHLSWMSSKNTSCKKSTTQLKLPSTRGHMKIESDENMLFEQLEYFCATENEIKKSPTTLSSYLYEQEIF